MSNDRILYILVIRWDFGGLRNEGYRIWASQPMANGKHVRPKRYATKEATWEAARMLRLRLENRP